MEVCWPFSHYYPVNYGTKTGTAQSCGHPQAFIIGKIGEAALLSALAAFLAFVVAFFAMLARTGCNNKKYRDQSRGAPRFDPMPLHAPSSFVPVYTYLPNWLAAVYACDLACLYIQSSCALLWISDALSARPTATSLSARLTRITPTIIFSGGEWAYCFGADPASGT